VALFLKVAPPLSLPSMPQSHDAKKSGEPERPAAQDFEIIM
jgi:hypothetical protein